MSAQEFRLWMAAYIEEPWGLADEAIRGLGKGGRGSRMMDASSPEAMAHLRGLARRAHGAAGAARGM